jgi:hypothetical protein
VELFTHPLCGGCREVFLELTRLAEAHAIELTTWSLATPSGKARALEADVPTVPTALVGSSRWTLDSRDALEALLEQLLSDSRGGAPSR